MTLLFVGEHFYPELGGLERSTERLAIGIQEYYREKVIFLTTNYGNEPFFSNRNGIDVYRFGNFLEMDGYSLKEGIDYIKKIHNPRFLSLFGIGDNADSRYWDSIFSSGIPSGLKIGTSGDTKVKNIDTDKLKNFGGIFCQNPSLEKEVLDLGISKEKIYKVRNGLDIEKWKGKTPDKMEARNILGIEQNRYVISGIGRFVKRKHFDKIVDGYLDFVNSYNGNLNPLLLLQGSDFGQDDGIEDILKDKLSKIDNNLYMLIDASENTEIALSASDSFITLGDREGAPNIILEAQALGKPVIATDISGHRVYIEESKSGILTSLNIKDISLSISKLIGNNFGKDDILTSANRFHIKNTAKMYLDSFESIINNS